MNDEDQRTNMDVLATIFGVLIGIGLCIVIWKVWHS